LIVVPGIFIVVLIVVLGIFIVILIVVPAICLDSSTGHFS
jgi:hypothetical protein